MANRTFADYAASLSSGTLDSVIGLDGSTVKTGEPGGAAYLVYTAMLTQTGTDAPVATVLENTLGGTVVWSYSGVGVYAATLSGAFTENKTFVIVGTFGDTSGIIVAYRNSDNQVRVQSAENDTDADGLLYETAIEIRVYP